jgi:hypothetical protein
VQGDPSPLGRGTDGPLRFTALWHAVLAIGLLMLTALR